MSSKLNKLNTSPKYPATLKARFKDAEAFQSAYLKDISGGGLYTPNGQDLRFLQQGV